MNAENAVVSYEAGQTAVAMVALTDQGDHKDFRSADTLWSNKSGYEPSVKPNGLATGGVVTPAAGGGNDHIDVAALTCYLAGVLTTVGAATNVDISRGVTTDICMITSITVTDAGAIAAVAGTDGTAFSTTRDAAGGPPLIPVGSIEIAQVRTTSVTAAPVAETEIFQVVGTHCERYDYPTWEEHRANVEAGILGNAGVEFAAALPLIHTGAVAKKVYAAYYVPEFTEVPKASDFVPPETTHSVASKQIYGKTLGSSASSLNQGSFVAYLEDGISDGLLAAKNQTLWFKFKQDRLRDPYILCQGKTGISRTFPAGDQISANVTISAEESALEVTA
ncbi:MAG: hypothetical protein HY770_06335 [Chitinivibrionia bacterium]|nr:hypothetical protein [Chitinivibrionia bacterium]